MEENRMGTEKIVHNDDCCQRCGSWTRHECHRGCGCGWWRAVKIIFLLVVAALIFGAGMLVGVVKGIRSGGWGSAGMMGSFSSSGWNMMADDGWRGGAWNMMGAGDGNRGATRMTGTITGVAGNKISISDNGAQAHVIISGSDTLIVVSGQPAGLAVLKSGQTIVAAGTLNAAGELQAQTIQVMP